MISKHKAGGEAVTIEMVRFTFAPDVVTLQAGVPMAITAVSHSRIPHNLTILSPEGQALKRVDIAAEQTVAFDVTLPRPGCYVFYCEASGLAPVGRREYMLGLVSICVGVNGAVGVKGHSGGRVYGEVGAPVSRYARTSWEESGRKRWVILASGVVLGIVAFQMIFELVELLSR